MSLETTEVLTYAPAVIRLLQGPLYQEDTKVWSLLLTHLQPLSRYFAQIGLELVLHQEDGFAYLTQPEEEQGGSGALPRLTKRTPLGYEVSLLALLLREALEEFDLNNADARDLFLTARDIKNRLLPYLGERYDEARAFKQFERYILTLVRLGFLKEAPSAESLDFDRRVFQVMRIIKARINNEKLEEMKGKMKAYGDTL